MSTAPRRRSRIAPLLSGAVVILAGFGIALVEALRLPKAAIWIVVAGAIAVIGLIRLLTRPRRRSAAGAGLAEPPRDVLRGPRGQGHDGQRGR